LARSAKRVSGGKKSFPLSNFSFTTVARGSSERSERSRGTAESSPLRSGYAATSEVLITSPTNGQYLARSAKRVSGGKKSFPLSNFSFTTVARGSSERSERSRGTAESSPLRSGYAATSEVLLSSPTNKA